MPGNSRSSTRQGEQPSGRDAVKPTFKGSDEGDMHAGACLER